MSSEQDIIQRAKAHLAALRELIESASRTLDDPEIEVKVKQLKAIQKTIERMEKGGVPIPDDLRHLRMNLAAQTAKSDNATRLLSYIRDEVALLLPFLGLKVGGKSPARSSRVYRLRRGQLTPQSVLRKAIIEGLEQMGGSGQVRDVLSRVYDSLKERFTAADLSRNKSGDVRWRNRCQWERFQMIQEGLLRDDSPRGVWELVRRREP